MKKYLKIIQNAGKRIAGFALITIMIFNLCACSDIIDQAANIIQEEDSHVLKVKNASPNAHPDKTYGEAFGNFFSSPTWRYFVGTKEGPDENGDGKPDYTEDDIDIVEFTGYCTYQETKVKALIQFTLSKDNKTFEATYLSFNDVPQNNLMLGILLEKPFIDEDTKEITEENKSETKSDKTEIHNEFAGTWWDIHSQRCNMNIELSGDVYYIDINWSSSANENTHWSFTGSYDNTKGGILYSGSKTDTYYTEQGYKHENIVYSDGKGLIRIDNSGALYWDDYKEQAGKNCCFEKEDNTPIEKNDYLFPSDTVYITESDLKYKSKDEVAMIRNEIYARHGYVFQTEPYKSYFAAKDWYYPNSNFSEALFNNIEKSNKEFIVQYEKKMGWR